METLFSSVPPATPSSPSRTLEGLFELTGRSSRALNLDTYVTSELQRYKETVRCGVLGAEVPGQRNKEQLAQTLIVCLLKTHLFLSLRKLEGPALPPG